MDPMTMGALINGGTQVLGKALTTPPTGPSESHLTGTYDFEADHSGWNVNFGGGTIDSTSTKTKTESNPISADGMASGLGLGGDWQTMALMGLALVAVWAIVRR
ncbi:hypothetical protein [Roseateles microcysteis]|uniref:hypothetical protein n=1 Tax=Roseateles microcysteis TaxID=3119057 RepID=UPI002FE534FD